MLLELEDWLYRDLRRVDKLLIIICLLGGAYQVKDIKKHAQQAGFKIPESWNISGLLKATNGLAIRKNLGWEITSKGRSHLLNLGVPLENSLPKNTSNELRNLLVCISNPQTKEFLEEAILCVEHSLHRAAIVMTWSAAIYLLRVEVIKSHLSNFNKEATRINSNWKIARNEDDLSLMKESDFLDRLENISVIGKDVKQQLKSCLALRNSCGHPNSLKVEKLKVASQIETLMQNVFIRFT